MQQRAELTHSRHNEEAERLLQVRSRRAYGCEGGMEPCAPDPRSTDPLSALPFEVVMLVFAELSPVDLAAASRVSRAWRVAGDDHRLWRDVCLRELTPEMDRAQIDVGNRDYKQLLKTEWLIRKWKQTHKRRSSSRRLTPGGGGGGRVGEDEEDEEYRRLNFEFEEKLLDMREMVSYKVVFFLRLFNSPLVDYFTVILWFLQGILLCLKLDSWVSWPWALALVPSFLLVLTVLGSTSTWFYFYALRSLVDTRFVQQCLFGWINVLCCCFSDDRVEASLWFSFTVLVSTLPFGLALRLLPWCLVVIPLACLVLSASFSYSGIVRPGASQSIKFSAAVLVLLAGAFFVLVLVRLVALRHSPKFTPWVLFSPLWATNAWLLLSGFTVCDPRFFLREHWFRNGLVTMSAVLVCLSPLAIFEVLLCLRLVGRVAHFTWALSPLILLLLGLVVLLVVGDFRLWSRIKHFWVIKRSFRFPLREHWRQADSVITKKHTAAEERVEIGSGPLSAPAAAGQGSSVVVSTSPGVGRQHGANEVVVMERDYSHGLYPPRFSCVDRASPVAQALQGRGVSVEDLGRVVNTVNGILEEAERVGLRTVSEGCLAYLTCFLSSMLCETHYSRCVRRLEKFLHEQNDYYYSYGIEWLNPMSNGLLHLDLLLKPQPPFIH